MKKTNKGEIILEGNTISEGVSVGKLVFIDDFPGETASEFSIQLHEVEYEVARFRSALSSSKKDLCHLERFLAREGSREAASIINAHIQMLADPFMIKFVEEKIRKMMKNTESVFRSVMTDYEKEFAKIGKSYRDQRLLDVKDLSNRILCHLISFKRLNLTTFPKGIIFFTKELLPSLASEATPAQVKGFITETGGPNSHAALIARSKGIPYISGVSIQGLNHYQNCDVIVDTRRDRVIVNPSKRKLTVHRLKKNGKCTKRGRSTIEGQTRDGCKLTFLTNIESIDDLKLVDQCGAHGIGLFRSEFLCSGEKLFSFSEEDQYELYRKIVKKANGKPLTFRLFDFGGDKSNLVGYEGEPNPALGCRAIRFLLCHLKVFKRQLRALIRLSLEGDLRILLPLVSDVTEVVEVKKLIKKLIFELSNEGHKVAKRVPIGSMIEVPSAVIACDLIAKESDFLSIGTNDLIQYTLATDRTRQDCHPFVTSMHPSIIRMIDHIAREGSRFNIPVSLCGEMAADPLMIPLLLGLGIRVFSCAPKHVPTIRKLSEELKVAKCQIQAKEVMKLKTSSEVERYLRGKFSS